jgi:immune inhibitor A
MKKLRLLLLLGVVCLSTGACQGTPTAIRDTHTPSPTATPTSPPPISPQEMAQILAGEEVPEHDVVTRMVQIGVLMPPVSRTISGTPRAYALGDTENFNFIDAFNPSALPRTARAELRYVTDHAYIWVEVGANVDQAALATAAENFENQIYPTVRDFFGEEWSPGVDQDIRISMLHMPNLGNASALFSSSDEYTSQVRPGSNQREMLYVNLDGLTIGSDSHLAMLAHEFQHMVQWNNPGNESHAFDEGLAQLSELLCGFEDTVPIVDFQKRCDTQLNAWVEGRADENRYYAANYLFAVYLWERLGDDFIRALSRHPGESLNSINATLIEQGRELDVNDLFADWIVANYLDDTTLADGRYGYRSEQVGSMCPRVRPGELPMQETRTMPQYSAEYIEIEGRGQVAFDFEGATTASLMPADAHSGHSFWWSNRGDDADMTLTRSFDLAGLDEATLRYWSWYDIQTPTEEFACVAVSTDDGETWVFPNTKQASQGPFYPCYAGVSGGGSQPHWVADEIDLTPYSGKKILVRFEYLTESWFNKPGFAVDDIEVPELDYTYDVESGNDGWEGAGFVRTSNRVPQGWALYLITMGRQVVVQQLEVSENGRAHADVALEEDGDKAVLVVGAMAPATKEEAQYQLRISGDLAGRATPIPLEAGVLFADDFSDVCSGWATSEDAQQVSGYVDGAYFLEVKTISASTWSQPGLDFSDISIDVDTTQHVSAVDNSWGVVCRYQDASNYYGFEISNDGFYTINARVNGQLTSLVEWTASGTINRGQAAANQITVTCNGDLLSLSVNGQLLTQVRDGSLTHGDIGFIASTYSRGGARLLFDNLVIRQP